MTLDEYAQEVGSALRTAHNAKNAGALKTAFDDADATLASNHISSTDRKAFWRAVRRAAFSGSWLIERQANSALAQLMQEIEEALAAREAEK